MSTITLQDLELLARAESPDFVRSLEAFCQQSEDEDENDRPIPPDALTFRRVRHELAHGRGRVDRGKKARELLKRYLAQREPPPSPQLSLAEMLVGFYEGNTRFGRSAILEIVERAALPYGVWGGVKRIYKLTETRLDAELFGAIAARFDYQYSDSSLDTDASHGTLKYLQRRAWRHLFNLGRAIPELYPQFAVEVLRRYTEEDFSGGRLMAHIVAHHIARGGSSIPKDLVKHRAYPAAWKLSPDPLLLLLDTCRNNVAARFAIQGLRADFPEQLRGLTPAFLARLASRPLESAHEFLVETLQANPIYHQANLAAVGLHEPVLELLRSPSGKARTYAIGYARAHGATLTAARVVAWLSEADEQNRADVVKFAAELLMSRPPRELGRELVAELLNVSATQKWATRSLDDAWKREELDLTFLVSMLFGKEEQAEWAAAYLGRRYRAEELDVSFWIRVLDDERARRDDADHTVGVDAAKKALSNLPLSKIPADWLLDALAREDLGSSAAAWLRKADALPPGFDLERLKGFVASAKTRSVALSVLGDPKLVSPSALGLPWLLALARRADATLSSFASRYLLVHMRPEHFAQGSPDVAQGTERLFNLATSPKESEAVRRFAQTYLLCHHPVIAKEEPEAKAHAIKPLLKRDAYTPERVWPALFDTRPDVRTFAVKVTRTELRKWGWQKRVYELAESTAKEVRNVAYDALLQAGEAGADPAITLTPAELEPAPIVSMLESRVRSTRDCGMELLRRHYVRLGGADRLPWLLQSADRDVQRFGVRLLWEKHRPRSTPPGWKPQGKHVRMEDAGVFDDGRELADVLRRVLFAVPPGRGAESSEAQRTKRMPASVVKRAVVELVRDLALREHSLALIAAPLFAELSGSIAKGEWHAGLAALLSLRRAWPDIPLEFRPTLGSEPAVATTGIETGAAISS